MMKRLKENGYLVFMLICVIFTVIGLIAKSRLLFIGLPIVSIFSTLFLLLGLWLESRNQRQKKKK